VLIINQNTKFKHLIETNWNKRHLPKPLKKRIKNIWNAGYVGLMASIRPASAGYAVKRHTPR
jgi:hypothetical protein